MVDAVVVGSGPNGLAAAITLAQAGREVVVYEGHDAVGGGMRTMEVTGQPGVRSDVCSSVHPFGAASPLFARLPLQRHGLEWVHPDLPLAHPLEGRPAATLARSLDVTVAGLGRDGARYRRVIEPIARRWPDLVEDLLGPLLDVPNHPIALAAFGLRAIWPAAGFARTAFRDAEACALFAGLACHAVMPLEQPLTAAFGVMFAAAGHVGGWPVARGGSQAIADALTGHLLDLGGVVVTDRRIESLAELDGVETVMLDITPRQLLALGGARLPPRYRRALERFRYGEAIFKVDYALDGPIPWSDPDCLRAATVHVGGTLAEVAAAESETARGGHPERPFLIVTQPSLFDRSRVPAGREVAWAYSHVPFGSTVDMAQRIDAQIERFAPGFRDRIVGRRDWSPAQMETYNPNYVGGAISGGSSAGLQVVLRPVPAPVPYVTPLDGVYLCSSSTPPGGGVHGMSGYHAARAALRRTGVGALSGGRRAQGAVSSGASSSR